MSPLPAPKLGLCVRLSPFTAPFPQKIVDKVSSEQYMNIKDLRMDSVSLLEQLDSPEGECTRTSNIAWDT